MDVLTHGEIVGSGGAVGTETANAPPASPELPPFVAGAFGEGDAALAAVALIHVGLLDSGYARHL